MDYCAVHSHAGARRVPFGPTFIASQGPVMMSLLRSNLPRVLPLILATIVVGVGAYFVGLNAINDMERSQADAAARSFGKYLVQQVPSLDRILTGRMPPSMSLVVLRGVKPIGRVIEYRLYDQDGQLRADSYRHSRGQPILTEQARSPEALALLVEGKQHFTINSGTESNAQSYYSQIMVPLISASGRTMGVLEVTSDETETWPGMFARFRSVILQVGILIVLAFGIPGILYLRNSGQLKLLAHRLRHSSEYDELTGTLNRATFNRAVQDLIDATADRGLSVAVHFIDIDRFKDVNDNLGHAVGDAVLQQVTQRLRRLTGGRPCVARLGADEFAICQTYFVSTPQVVPEFANDVIKAISEPMMVGAHAVQIGASVGYCYYPRDGKTVPDIIRAADIALFKAKQSSRGSAVAFVPAMEEERQTRQNIEARLRAALANGEFDIHFQPLYEVATDRLRGFEALLRLSDNNGRPISPADFIPIAEETGLIQPIGDWALREACRMATQWPADLMVAVNLSAAQFASGSLADSIQDALVRTGLPANRLELEVTESLLITDPEKVLAQLNAIKAAGASVALDDFGTGYSSLSYLWQFPFNKLKVDKSFMKELAVEGSKSREILATIIALGKVLDMKITAEGVETIEQAAVLRALKCDLVQGYLFGRPMRAIDVAATIIQQVSGRWPDEKPANVTPINRAGA